MHAGRLSVQSQPLLAVGRSNEAVNGFY